MFASGPGGKDGPGWYLALLNWSYDGAAAVGVVRTCLDRSRDRPGDTANLLLMDDWRPQLVGCVALLIADPADRAVGELLQAIRRGSWIAPQLLATAALACPAGWEADVAADVLERGDSKAAAAFVAVSSSVPPELQALAAADDEGGAEIVRQWHTCLASALDEAGIGRAWPAPQDREPWQMGPDDDPHLREL